MEIKINEKESYVIKLPEVIEASEFLSLLNSMNNIKKIIVNNPMLDSNLTDDSMNINNKGTLRIRNKANPIPVVKNREDVIKLIKLHYFGTDIQKNEFAESINRVWNDIPKRLTAYKKKYNIKPEEVNLRSFPTRYEARGNIAHLVIDKSML